MLRAIACNIMRTTIDIDDPILKEIKELQRREGKSLGQLVSELLAQALADARKAPKSVPHFRWIAKPMGARVDLGGKDAMFDAMDNASQ